MVVNCQVRPSICTELSLYTGTRVNRYISDTWKVKTDELKNRVRISTYPHTSRVKRSFSLKFIVRCTSELKHRVRISTFPHTSRVKRSFSLKFIVRCTSVCKSWYSLIKSPIFIALHLDRPDNTKYLFCAYGANLHPEDRYLSMHYDNEAFVEYYRLVFPHKQRYQIRIHGSCNGLLCYSEFGESDVYLWNPTIRKLKGLPKYPHCENYGTAWRSFGFWFAKRVNDYRVALLSYTAENVASAVDVYRLSTNSWKTITESIPGTSKMQGGFELAYVDGTLHWPSKRDNGCMIFSLDITSGMFRDTLISWGSDRRLSTLYLAALGEHALADFGSRFTGSKDIYRCCMVQVYDQSLNKLYTVDLEKDICFDLEHVVGLRNNGEALFPKPDRHNKLKRPSDTGIVSCSIQTKDCKEFVKELDYNVRTFSREHKGIVYYHSRVLRQVRPFIETLVLLDDADTEETSTPNYRLTEFGNALE